MKTKILVSFIIFIFLITCSSKKKTSVTFWHVMGGPLGKKLEENPRYDKIVEQLEFAKTEPKVKEWFTGRIYLNEAMEEAVRLERTPQEALDNAAQRILIETQY